MLAVVCAGLVRRRRERERSTSSASRVRARLRTAALLGNEGTVCGGAFTCASGSVRDGLRCADACLAVRCGLAEEMAVGGPEGSVVRFRAFAGRRLDG